MRQTHVDSITAKHTLEFGETRQIGSNTLFEKFSEVDPALEGNLDNE